MTTQVLALPQQTICTLFFCEDMILHHDLADVFDTQIHVTKVVHFGSFQHGVFLPHSKTITVRARPSFSNVFTFYRLDVCLFFVFDAIVETGVVCTRCLRALSCLSFNSSSVLLLSNNGDTIDFEAAVLLCSSISIGSWRASSTTLISRALTVVLVLTSAVERRRFFIWLTVSFSEYRQSTEGCLLDFLGSFWSITSRARRQGVVFTRSNCVFRVPTRCVELATPLTTEEVLVESSLALELGAKLLVDYLLDVLRGD